MHMKYITSAGFGIFVAMFLIAGAVGVVPGVSYAQSWDYIGSGVDTYPTTYDGGCCSWDYVGSGSDYGTSWDYIGSSYDYTPSWDYIGSSYDYTTPSWDYIGSNYDYTPSWDYIGSSYGYGTSWDYIGSNHGTSWDYIGSSGYYYTPTYYSTPSYSYSKPITVSSPKVSYNIVDIARPVTIASPTKTTITKVVDKQVNVQYVYAPTCSIYATPNSINANQTATIVWSSQNATSGHLSSGGSVGASGSQSVNPSVTTTYTLTVYNSSGQAGNCQTTVYVNQVQQAPSCQITHALPSGGNQAHLSWTSQNATSANLYGVGSVSTNGSYIVSSQGAQTYTLTVYNSQGQSANCQTVVYVSQPPVQLPTGLVNAYPSSIQNGAYSTLSWTSQNAMSARLSDGLGNVALNGSLLVRPEANRTYTMTVTDSQGRTNICNASLNVSGSYISLTQIPYTGFDFGPFGNAMYWLVLLMLAGGAAYLVIFYRGGVVGVARETLQLLLVPAGGALSVLKNDERIDPVKNSAERNFGSAEFHRVDVADLPVRQSEVARATKDSMSVVVSRDGEAPRIVISRE